MKTVNIYTDGACRGNPGIGGWGALVEYGDVSKEYYGGNKKTTNNQMELQAAIEGLKILNVMDGLGQSVDCTASFSSALARAACRCASWSLRAFARASCADWRSPRLRSNP